MSKVFTSIGLTRSRLLTTIVFLAIVVFILFPESACAQNGEIFPITDHVFFLNTGGFGARALGFGGAFISIADDASAIEWNPAGMGSNHVMHALVEIINREGQVNGFESSDLSSVPIAVKSVINAALVFPTEHGNLGIGVFNSASWNHEWHWLTQQNPEQSQNPYSFKNMNDRSRLSIYNIDLSYSYDFSPGFSVGVTGRFHQMLKSSFFSVVDANEEYIWLKEVKTRRYDISGILGLQYRPLDSLALAAVVKSPAEFSYNSYRGDGFLKKDFIRLPFTAGIGLSFDPWKYLKLSADYNFVQYSEMYKPLSTDENGQSTEIIPLVSPDDGWEYHVGMQILAPMTVVNRFFVAGIRGGAYNKWPHNAHYDSTTGVNASYEEMYPEDLNEERHYTAGLSGRYQEFQVDFGADWDQRGYRAFTISVKSFVTPQQILNTVRGKLSNAQ